MTSEERWTRMQEELMEMRATLNAAKRRYRLTLFTVALVGIGLGLTWGLVGPEVISQAQAADAGSKAIRAGQFILEDTSGRTRAMLCVNKGGPVLAMYDANGSPRSSLSVNENGPGLVLLDASGKTRVMLCMNKDLGPMLALDDTRATLRVSENGPMLALADANGRLCVGLAAMPGEPVLSIFNTSGDVVWSAP